MRALTIRQPWAQLIVDGHKDIENRSWSTKWRGPLLIHAGLQYDTSARIPDPGPDYPAEMNALRLEELAETMRRADRRRGMIVGVVQLVDIVRNDPSPWAQADQHHWKLDDPIAFDEPIMSSGRQGLWMPSTREANAVNDRTGSKPWRL